MSASSRTRRMKRNHRRLQQQPKLNLVALMDIFTILVLFLMVNNGDVEVLQADKSVVLPDSVSEARPSQEFAAMLYQVAQCSQQCMICKHMHTPTIGQLLTLEFWSLHA